MPDALATLLVFALEVYLGIGLLVAVPFALRGVNRIDPLAVEATRGFRALIVPGATLLWPLVLRRWWAGAQPPAEWNPHRAAARAATDARRPR